MTFYHNALAATKQNYRLAKEHVTQVRRLPIAERERLWDAVDRVDAAREMYFRELVKGQPTQTDPIAG